MISFCRCRPGAHLMGSKGCQGCEKKSIYAVGGSAEALLREEANKLERALEHSGCRISVAANKYNIAKTLWLTAIKGLAPNGSSPPLLGAEL